MSYLAYKMIGSLAEPGNFLIAFLALGAALSFVPWRGVWRVGRALAGLCALALFVIAALPVGQWALLPLENRFAVREDALPPQVDGIIVLTGDESAFLSEWRGVPIAGHAAGRHIFMAGLAQKYPAARIVVAGNPTPFHGDGHETTRTVLEAIYKKIGVPLDRVTFEADSRTTHENARNVKALLGDVGAARWLLVTSAFHMPRSYLCFKNEGLETIPAPSDYFTHGRPQWPYHLDAQHQIRLLTAAWREYVGIFAYWLAGWVPRLWP